MKKIKKGMINSFQVKEERDIMILGRKSEWLTTLQYAFQVNFRMLEKYQTRSFYIKFLFS